MNLQQIQRQLTIVKSAEHFYPDGFRVEMGSCLTLALIPGATQLSLLSSADKTNRQKASLVH